MYCHVNVKTGSRGTGQSAAAKYDYISRAGKYGAASRNEVVHLESGSMPSFASSDARLYWAAADCHERSNGRLFRSLTAALPNSLDSAGWLDLARSFAAHVTAGELPYTLAVHAGVSKKAGVADNPHLHLVFSERVNDGVERAAEQWFRRAAPTGGDPASGGARKSERTKPRAWLEETRQAWAAQMNLAFNRAGVSDRVTPESHAAQLARAREAGDAAAAERLLLNPPSAHIGPAAKHRWEDRSPAQKPDRYVAYEEASASAREARSAHARAAAEAAEARSTIKKLDAEIAALEAEQRRADDAAARRRQQADARPEAERRRAEAKRDEERKARRTALVGVPGGVELFLANLADLDPKWNVDGNDATTGANVDAALDAAESDEMRLGRLRGVLSDEAADARFRQQLARRGGRFGTADLDDAVATAEALRKRVSRVRELFATPGGDAALVAALEDRNRSWSRSGTPTDIERALDVAERRLDRRQAATWEHRVVLEAEQVFPDAPSAAWRRTGEGFGEFTETGRPGRRLTRTLSERARAVAIAAERPEPPASPGLVKRLFEWMRERVQRMLHRLRPSRAGHRRDRSAGGDVEPARAVAAEREPAERNLAGQLVAAARTAARRWGNTTLATDTLISAAASIGAQPKTSAAQRAVLEQISWETAPSVGLSTEAAGLRRRCLAEKQAAADERHRQALGEWSALPRGRRWLTPRPERERPAPPSRQEVAAARDELVGVVRSAMIAELEKVMPQPRPASPPADGARTPPVAAAAHRDQPLPPSRAPLRSDGPVERPAEGRRHVPVRAPDTRPEPATSPPRPPAPRDRGQEPSL